MQIKPEILDILNQSAIVSNGLFSLTLPNIQLDRKTYLEVNKVLEALGGKWNKKHKAHIFETDPTPQFTKAVEEKQVVIHTEGIWVK